MSKTNKSKSGSRSSRSRSVSRSRSRSFSKSRSRSRSISHPKKRKHSSRSRSRSYSPAHNRERNLPRVYQNRDFRGHNRGYRRPYYNFRGWGRGFYPRGQHNRGGYGNYRPNWQNYNRQPYSPRRARSRSRTPKRRSPSRSRSRSRNSDKSSSDRTRSSSSRSSSSVEISKRKSRKEKKTQSKDKRGSLQTSMEDDSKDPSSADGNTKAAEGSKAWEDMTYDTSPTAQHSSTERGPTLKSSVQSVVVRRCSPRSSPSPQGSALQSGTSFRVMSRQSPFEHSLSPPKKSPLTKSPPILSSIYGGNQKEEGRSGESSGLGGITYSKRYMEEKSKGSEQDKENGKEKLSLEKMRDRISPNDFAMNELEKAYRRSQSPKKYKFREDFEKMKMTEFHKEGRYSKEENDEPEKKGLIRSRKDSDFDNEPKGLSKAMASSSKNQDPYDPAKWEEISFISSSKEKHRKSDEMEEEEEEMYLERYKKEERMVSKRAEGGHRGFFPEKNFRVTSFKAIQEKNSSSPQRKTSEGREREKMAVREDAALGKSTFCVNREMGANLRIDSFDEDLARPSGILAHERKLCRDLVHSNKKDQEFRSIFQHIKSAQPQRSPSELFAQHIVTIVHHVREHHFGSSGMTLNERFTKYLKRSGTDQESAKSKKSPEIHRIIDISPSAFRKHGFVQEETKPAKESSHKAEGKFKDDPVDLRLDNERRKKHKDRDSKRDRSRDSLDSRDSSHSRERSTEKPEKSRKGSKKHKKHRRLRARSRSSSTSSQSSHSCRVGGGAAGAGGGEEYPTAESEEKEEGVTGFDKSRLGTKDFVGPNERGRARGNFQFRARGRGWGRGTFPVTSSNNNNNNNDFQKRNRDEEWDPEYTPKSKKYYLHDDREGENEEKWVNRGRGRGAFPRGRGRFLYRKPGTSPKWAHDKFSGEEGEIEDEESGAETREEKENTLATAE
ncbi:thyroid hormone receptor-associated protein 3 isoform X1 [Microcaecilia unicolor]|uniref:Thyroid hormone receptor-associated protein 3 isoform X1 n=1 Tax=Microcaecilia unicolor TaxID=1415580 RepID=A0A6P7ZBN0_9AMPH|nr:thyroid hormone receptor-associated protein 3 isoform X1 [Microcaecilia unicolor]XP_030073951.1 thyroid hormone receptor-associated protein 3 isoform X1 [Microcaecilia unicolor]